MRDDVQPHVVVDRVGAHRLDDRVEERRRAGSGSAQVRAERDGAQVLAQVRRALRRLAEPARARRRSPRAPGARSSPRARRSSTAPAQPAKRRRERLARGHLARPPRTTDAMFPRPPHWATNGAPGVQRGADAREQRSWSAIQWNVALETAASAGGVDAQLEQVLLGERRARVVAEPPRAPPRPSRAEPSIADDAAVRTEALQQLRGHAAGAAAEVEHGLVAAQRQPVEDLRAPRLMRRARGRGRLPASHSRGGRGWRRPYTPILSCRA